MRKKQEQFIINAQKLDLIHSTRQKKFRIQFSMLIKQLTIILFLYSIDNILYQSFQLFACINIGDQKNQERRILNDLTISCDSFATKQWFNSLKFNSQKRQFIVCTPILIIFGIIFPLSLIFILIYNYKLKRIDYTSIKFQFGFMYYAFDKKYFFWEIIIIFRKILISIITIIFAQEIKFLDNYPSILICFVITISTILQLLVQPYNQTDFQKLNQFENLSLITQLISILLFIFQLYTIDDVSEPIRFINLWILIFINIFFVFFFISLFFKHKLLPKLKQIQEQVQSIKTRIFGLSQVKKTVNQSYYFSRSQKTKQATIQEEDTSSYKPVPKSIEESLKNEIKSLKAIIKLKNEEIYILKQRLEQTPMTINESIYLENKILETEYSKTESLQIEENYKNINIRPDESQRIISQSYLTNELILVKHKNFIIRKQNFLQGEYCNLNSMSCGSQTLIFISHNIQLVILDVQVQLPTCELEEHGIYATISKAKRKVMPEQEQITYEFYIFYEFLDLKKNENYELIFYPYIKIIYETDIIEQIFNLPLIFSLADFLVFKKRDKNEQQELDNQLNLNNNNEADEKEQKFLQFISHQLMNSFNNFEQKSIYGEFELNIPNGHKCPLKYSYNILFNKFELFDIKIEEKMNYFFNQLSMNILKQLTHIFEITIMSIIKQYKEQIG